MKSFIFKPGLFLLCNILAFLIFFSWLNAHSKLYWDLVDYQAVEFLNGSLGQSANFWNAMWAVLNVRITDFVPLFFILTFFYFDNILFKKGQRLIGLIRFVSLLVLMLIVREGVNFYIDYNHLNRKSPSLTLEAVIRLSEIYPNINLKDASSNSFPGDHAAILLTWFGYCLFFARNTWSLLAVFLVVFFSLPRLIAGAHWLSDILVGGAGIAFITLAFGLYTPLLNKVNQFLVEVTQHFIQNIITKTKWKKSAN